MCKMKEERKKKSKKIIILTQYFPPEMGAPQTRLYEMAQGLKKLDWEVMVICALPNYPTGKIFANYRKCIYTSEFLDGLKVFRWCLYPSNSTKRLPRIVSMISFSFTSLFSIFQLWRIRPDYLFVESPPLTLGFSGWLLSRLSGARFVFNVSDIWPLTARELGALRAGWRYDLLERLELFIYRHADICTGQSREIVKHISERTSAPAYLFRNGVDPSRFAPLPDKELHNPFQLVYAGLLGLAQGIYNICRQINFAELGAEFHIFGAGGEQEKIEAFLDMHKDRGIYYHGKKSREEIEQLLPKYDAAFIPLVKHIPGALPSKVYEAMASGLPIVFSGGGEGAQLVEEYDLGWVCTPLDIDAMQATIKLIKTDPDSWYRKRMNCIRAAREVFSREVQVEKLDEILRQKL